MEVNTTNISLNRYLELVEIEKNFNRKFKVVHVSTGGSFRRHIEYYSDNETFENEILEDFKIIYAKLSKENSTNIKLIDELEAKIEKLERHSVYDKNTIESYKNKNLIQRILNKNK